MKNESSKNVFLEKYIYINYFLVFAFLVINLIFGRDYRDIIFTSFVILMFPLLIYKIKNELNYDRTNGTKLAQNTIIKMLFIFIVLVTIYLVMQQLGLLKNQPTLTEHRFLEFIKRFIHLKLFWYTNRFTIHEITNSMI